MEETVYTVNMYYFQWLIKKPIAGRVEFRQESQTERMMGGRRAESLRSLKVRQTCCVERRHCHVAESR